MGRPRKYATEEERRAAKAVQYQQNRVAILAKVSERRRDTPEIFKARELAYDQRHREERNEKARNRYQANPEYEKAKRQTPKSKARGRKNAYKHYHAHIVTSREKGRRAAALHKARHPERVLLRAKLSRARRRGLPANFTMAHRTFMLNYWGHACASCGNQQGFEWKLAEDHWIPMKAPDCPGTVPWNIVPLCHGRGGCNNIKGSKNARAWLVGQFGPRKARMIEQKIATYFAIVQERFHTPEAAAD